MIGVALALLSSIVLAFSVVLVGKSLDQSSFFSAAMVVTIIGNLVLWPLTFMFTNLDAISLEGFMLFAVAGFFIPGTTRLLYFKGVEAVGVSINSSLLATHPMYSSLLAVLLLGEVLAPENWIGIACVIVGVVFVSLSRTPGSGSKSISRKGLIFPFLAASIGSFALILRKQALNICNEPLFGVATGYTSALLLYLLILTSTQKKTRDSVFSGENFGMFWKAGVCISVGWLIFFYALSHEKVSIVTSLGLTEALFVILFARVILRKREKITPVLVAGTLSTIIGAMLVVLH